MARKKRGNYNQELSLKDKGITILGAFGALFIWLILMIAFLKFLFPPSPSPWGEINYQFDIIGTYLLQYWGELPWYTTFFFACIMAPLWEEAVFRKGAIGIAQTWGKAAVIPMILIASCVFGLVHRQGVPGIMLQGVGGVVLSMVYLRNNNSYWSAVILHSMYNAMAVYGLPLLT